MIAGPVERALDGVDEFFHAISAGEGFIAVDDLAARMAASGKTREGANIEENIKMVCNTFLSTAHCNLVNLIIITSNFGLKLNDEISIPGMCIHKKTFICTYFIS